MKKRCVPGIYTLSVLLAVAGCSTFRLASTDSPAREEWRMPGGNPQQTNQSHDSLSPPLMLKWSADISAGSGTTAMVVSGGTLFVSTLHGEVQAFSVANGDEEGSRRFGSCILGAPVAVGNRLYVGISGDKSSLVAWDLPEGRNAWLLGMGDVESSPLIIGERIVFCTLSGTLVCAAVKTGDILWSYSLPMPARQSSVHSSPATDGRIIVFGSDDGRLTAVSADSGIHRWTFRARSGIIGAPAISGGRVFTGALDSMFYAIDAGTGSLVWSRCLGAAIYSAPSVGGGRIFTGTSGRRIVSLTADLGTIVWSYETKGPVSSAPVISGNVLYAGSLDRTLYAIDAVTGNLLWKHELDGRIRSSIIVSDTTLFVLSDNRKVSAFIPEAPR